MSKQYQKKLEDYYRFICKIQNTNKKNLQKIVEVSIDPKNYSEEDDYAIDIKYSIDGNYSGKGEFRVEPEMQILREVRFYPLIKYPELRRDGGSEKRIKVNDIGLGSLFELKTLIKLVEENHINKEYSVNQTSKGYIITPVRFVQLEGLGLTVCSTPIAEYLQKFIDFSRKKGYDFKNAEEYLN